ncbi:hypothetical protein ACGFZJ_09825 [Streptomyces sp. NPDC048253]|uniref:hypothetical protein n=1 Tax=unclassified Streptomyces TaxID=2593676 RepID=UPI0006BB3562|nr:hypothetical protein OV320_0773 [Actinobacteria bacterium OV320]
MSLTSAQSATLLALAGALIPAGEREPAADTVLADGYWLGRGFAAEPRLEAVVAQICDRLRGQDPATALRSLAEVDPTEFDALTTVVAGAYYMVPEVRVAIGYPGQIPRPAGLTEAVDDLEEELIAPMLAGEPRYRPTPDGPGESPA